MARDGAQTEILRVAIASELTIPTAELTAESYPAAGGATHAEEIFDCGAHAAQATPAQLIAPSRASSSRSRTCRTAGSSTTSSASYATLSSTM